jgi:hypothetical protein
MCPGSYCWWLQLQYCGGLTGVCVAAVSHQVEYYIKHLSLSLNSIQLNVAEVFVER